MSALLDNALGDAIAAVAPHMSDTDLQSWWDALEPAMDAAGINTPKRVAAFLGQVAVESGAFTQLSENLNYSAPRMCQVWPSRFTSLAAATPYAMNSQKLACRVYAGRLGNGDEASGDGWTYRGRGLIQLTGKSLYTQFGQSCSKSASEAAAYLETKEGAAASACWYWNMRKLNPLADAWNVSQITRYVNGGLNNLQNRINLSNAALAAIQADAAA